MMKKRNFLLGFALLLTACTPIALSTSNVLPTQKSGTELDTLAPADTPVVEETVPIQTPGSTSEQNIQPFPTNNRIPDSEEYAIPPALLPYDGIAPVYKPEFVPATESPLEPDELVMGISINRESKAYPVSVLRFREMVDDELAGWPILVSW
jgi:hypothetical protein